MKLIEVSCKIFLIIFFQVIFLHFAQATSPKSEARILFTTNRDTNSEIYQMSADGTGQKNLTRHPAEDSFPVWSPDHRKVAFQSNRDGTFQIYIMDSDGKNLINISRNSFNDQHPSWSTDGKKILFSSDRQGRNSIYVMSADGTTVRRLTGASGSDDFPRWSPNGKMILFQRSGPSNTDIFLMKTDGSGKVNLTKNPARDQDAYWSPDGKKILFSSNRDTCPGLCNLQIYSMNSKGGHATRVTIGTSNDRHPIWSPDGNIFFTSDREINRNVQIYKMKTDGSNLTRVSASNADDLMADLEVEILFFDDFEDGILATDWLYRRGTWSEEGGSLIGKSQYPARAMGLASPAFGGCSLCRVKTSVSTVGGDFSFVAWWLDEAHNIQLTFKPASNGVVLRQRSGGTAAKQKTYKMQILPNTYYDVEMEYDGTNIYLRINGTLAITFLTVAVPNGTVGLRLPSEQANMAFIQVETL